MITTRDHGDRKFDALQRFSYDEFAGWSSLVARRAHNPKVASSNLAPATMGSVPRHGAEPFSHTDRKCERWI